MKKQESELADQFQFPCPYCGKSIRLSEVLSHGMKEGLEKELDEKVRVREVELARKARERVEKEVFLQLKDLQEQIAEKEKRLEFVERTELALIKDRRHLEEERKRIHLDVVRKVEGERKRIEEETAKRIQDENRLREADKDKKMADLLRQIEDLKHRAEQTSSQASGEVMELSLEDVLRRAFSADEVVPVPKGIKGADILQRVKSPSGQLCGVIAWEAKRTKGWKDDWIRKLKDDQIRVKADVAALVTEVLPKEVVKAFGIVDGVWVLGPGLVVGVATALRMALIQAAGSRMALVGKAEKMESLYGYLSGPVFRGRVEALVESFISLKEDLDSEQRAMERVWAKRAKTIERAIGNSAGFVGDLEGVLGSGLPGIKGLELKQLAAGAGEAS